jgi:hypothetical protein
MMRQRPAGAIGGAAAQQGRDRLTEARSGRIRSTACTDCSAAERPVQATLSGMLRPGSAGQSVAYERTLVRLPAYSQPDLRLIEVANGRHVHQTSRRLIGFDKAALLSKLNGAKGFAHSSHRR